jgi:hypothetical protein
MRFGATGQGFQQHYLIPTTIVETSHFRRLPSLELSRLSPLIRGCAEPLGFLASAALMHGALYHGTAFARLADDIFLKTLCR